MKGKQNNGCFYHLYFEYETGMNEEFSGNRIHSRLKVVYSKYYVNYLKELFIFTRIVLISEYFLEGHFST